MIESQRRPAPAIVFVHGCDENFKQWLDPGFGDSDRYTKLTSVKDGRGADLDVFFSENAIGLSPFQFLYYLDFSRSRHGIRDLATGLGRAIHHICDPAQSGHPGIDNVVVVAFSMGSLVARCYVQGLATNLQFSNDVAGLFLLAPPNNGSIMARLIPRPLAALSRLVPRRLPGPWLCPQASELSPRSPLITELNDQSLRQDVAYAVAAGVGCNSPFPHFLQMGRHDGIIFESETDLEGREEPDVNYYRTEVNGVHTKGPLHLPHCSSDVPQILSELRTKYLINGWYLANWGYPW
jgi:pimeloyl-ACP methyl ester carboxylesterase